MSHYRKFGELQQSIHDVLACANTAYLRRVQVQFALKYRKEKPGIPSPVRACALCLRLAHCALRSCPKSLTALSTRTGFTSKQRTSRFALDCTMAHNARRTMSNIDHHILRVLKFKSEFFKR
jgi:hypothetical protein